MTVPHGKRGELPTVPELRCKHHMLTVGGVNDGAQLVVDLGGPVMVHQVEN